MARQAAARSLLPRHTRWQALQQRLCGTNSSSISKLMGRRQLVPTRPLRPLCSASAAPGDSADDDASHTGSRAWRLRPPAVRSTPLRRCAAYKAAPVSKRCACCANAALPHTAAQVALPAALKGPGRWFLLAGVLKVLQLTHAHSPLAHTFVVLGAGRHPWLCAKLLQRSPCLTRCAVQALRCPKA